MLHIFPIVIIIIPKINIEILLQIASTDGLKYALNSQFP